MLPVLCMVAGAAWLSTRAMAAYGGNAEYPVPPSFWVVSFGLMGAILGSYVNMAAYRLPRGIPIAERKRSFCPSCQHQLYWYDNLPLFSYLTLLGRCRYCKKPIGVRYLLTELAMALLFALAAYQLFGLNTPLAWGPDYTGNMPREMFVLQLFLIVDLLLLAIVDLETWLIPVETTLPWLVAGLIAAPIFPDLHLGASLWFKPVPYGIGSLNAFIDSFQGVVLGLGVPWLINFGTTFLSFYYYRLRGIAARPLEGMGEGDAHVLGMVGALLGWKAAMATLLIGIFVAITTYIPLKLWDRIQQRRLGDKWKPWEPSYELPAGAGSGAPPAPVYWPLVVMGAVVLAAVALLREQSIRSFSGYSGLEIPGLDTLDLRMIPVAAMAMIGVATIFAAGFYKYLDSINMLPQGTVEESATGEKKEVLKGNYVPFGPSLAAGALIVVFYGPLIREVAYWFATGGGRVNLPVYRTIGDDLIRRTLG